MFFTEISMPDDFGFDHYIWQNGERLRTRIVRSLRPNLRETNGQFEQRMTTMVAQIAQMHGVLNVAFAFEWRSAAIVECIIDVQHTPRAAPITEDARPAGGRAMPPRGKRGGGNASDRAA